MAAPTGKFGKASAVPVKNVAGEAAAAADAPQPADGTAPSTSSGCKRWRTFKPTIPQRRSSSAARVAQPVWDRPHPGAYGCRVTDTPLHADRTRAESFGTVAGRYDRFRPTYPPALFELLRDVAPGPAVLDVGCGTGKASVALGGLGFDVLGVEADDRMADVARSHGISVDTATFEGWDPRGRTFDLITCGQAWHWIDAAAGSAMAASLLNPGGALALFWNYAEVPARVRAVLDAVYAEHAPELAQGMYGVPVQRRRNDTAEGAAAPAFATVAVHDFTWERTYTGTEWAGMVGTHSDHIRLGAERVTALAGAVESQLGDFTAVYNTHLILATDPRR